jgi:hypothetical protein
MTVEALLKPAAAASLATWHRAIASRDASSLPPIRDDAVFRSPMAHKPYHSAAAVKLVLGTVINVFENFAYHRELATADGLNVVLEFSATVNGKDIKGIDLIRFDDEGRIAEIEVMVRPFSGLQALGEEMARRVGATLPAFKGA